MNERNRVRLCGAVLRLIACFALVLSAKTAMLYGQPSAIYSATAVNTSNGNAVTMPLKRNFSRSSRLSLVLDPRWTQNYGYRPVEVTFKSPKPTTQDHTIAIRLYTGTDGHSQVEQALVLPKGSTSATTVIDVPQYQSTMPFYWWDVWVDGFKDKDLTLEKVDAYSVMQSGYSATAGIAILSMTQQSAQTKKLAAPSTMEFEVLSLTAGGFPQRWIEYTCFDMVTLSIDEITALRQQNPPAFLAMTRWLRSGGQLWVNNVGDQYAQLPELSKLLGLYESMAPVVSQSTKEVDADDGDNGAREDTTAGPRPNVVTGTSGEWIGWRPSRFFGGVPDDQTVTFLDNRDGNQITESDPQKIRQMEADSNYTKVGQRYDPVEVSQRMQRTGSSSQWFVQQSIGLGTVRAYRRMNQISEFQQARPAAKPANPNAAVSTVNNPNGDEQLPNAVKDTVQSLRRWSARHGMVPDDANLAFSNLMVPGMGLAPVTEFQILITLFVLAIGPLNYWLLRRWRRLHLLVLTVPLAATMVTLALFGYAIVADGFATSVRAHSFTNINQRTGETACWSRLSYYSGLTARGGLVMPADVAMYPIIPNWNASTIDAYVNAERDLVWEPEEARLTRGWLRSRTPTQYLTLRSRQAPWRLDLQPVRDRMRATNSLGTRIQFVAVVDGANQWWLGENLDKGAVGFLTKIAKDEAIAKFSKLVRDNAPQSPTSLSEDSRYASIQRQQWRSYRARYAMNAGYTGDHSLQSNLANEAILTLAGNGTRRREPMSLPPQSYVAVTDTGPEVVFGMDGVEEEASFHVIVGQW